MIAGIPGTGIGGIYYILLALLMPVHEACLTVVGCSSWRRWGIVSMQVVHALGILGSIYGMGWLLAQGINALRFNLVAGQSGAYIRLTNVVATTSAYMSVLTLGVVLLVVYTLRLIVRDPQRAR